MTLAAGAAATLGFSWNTSGAGIGSHKLTAAAVLASDTNSANNSASTTSTVTAVNVVTVSSISPNTIRRGTTTTFTIRGSGFKPGARVTFANGGASTPRVSSVVVSADGTSITAIVSVSSRARGTTWDVRVTNPDGSTGVLLRAFSVTTRLPPPSADTFLTANRLPHANPDYPLLAPASPVGADDEHADRDQRNRSGLAAAAVDHLFAGRLPYGLFFR